MASTFSASIQRDPRGGRRLLREPLAFHVGVGQTDGSTAPQRAKHLADTVIQSGLTIEGSLMSGGNVRLNGTVQGRVEVQGRLDLGSEGSVLSSVSAGQLSVGGLIRGNVQGRERVDLLSGARLHGNVKTPRLTMADGATFFGQVEMESKP
jgi:cytoskeletal protein CcmA (bactofilin family)